MFLSHELLLELGFPEARSALDRLVASGWLQDTSGEAYAEGLRGSAAGAGRAVPAPIGLRLLDPVSREAGVLLPMRWETIGCAAPPFPVLDADLTLDPVAGHITRLALTGSYRPHREAFAPGPDQAAVRAVAAATVSTLLARIAAAIGTGRPVPGVIAGEPAGDRTSASRSGRRATG
ncbi:MAG: hypothetical protein J2P35_00155 [Actinobacteria bacterium]|nr:hypothetical protein [Actinomycetota bacterium]MBO0785106.1 hypothetical protein [Actinomycetota bacterium]